MYITKIDDSEYKKIMKKRLKESNGYCPDALIRTPDMKCPCEAFRNMNKEGYCDCGYLYKHLDDEIDEYERN